MGLNEKWKEIKAKFDEWIESWTFPDGAELEEDEQDGDGTNEKKEKRNWIKAKLEEIKAKFDEWIESWTIPDGAELEEDDELDERPKEELSYELKWLAPEVCSTENLIPKILERLGANSQIFRIPQLRNKIIERCKQILEENGMFLGESCTVAERLEILKMIQESSVIDYERLQKASDSPYYMGISIDAKTGEITWMQKSYNRNSTGEAISAEIKEVYAFNPKDNTGKIEFDGAQDETQDTGNNGDNATRSAIEKKKRIVEVYNLAGIQLSCEAYQHEKNCGRNIRPTVHWTRTRDEQNPLIGYEENHMSQEGVGVFYPIAHMCLEQLRPEKNEGILETEISDEYIMDYMLRNKKSIIEAINQMPEKQKRGLIALMEVDTKVILGFDNVHDR